MRVDGIAEGQGGIMASAISVLEQKRLMGELMVMFFFSLILRKYAGKWGNTR